MPKTVDGLDGNRILSFIERVERLEEEKKGLQGDIKDIWEEAKGAGFNVKILKRLITVRKQDQEKMRMEEADLQSYLSAIGMD